MSNIKAQTQPQTELKPSQSYQNTTQNIQTARKQNQIQSNIGAIYTQIQRPQTTNIFAQTNQIRNPMNIFNQQANNQERRNIFGAQLKSVNLFNVTSLPQNQNSNNIFKTDSKPLVKSQDNDEKSSSNSSGNSRSTNQKQMQFKNQPQIKIMKFQYKNPWTILKTFNLKRFKNGRNCSKQNTYLTFQTHKDHQNKTFIVVRFKETKIIIFQGFGLQNLSNKSSNFMNKDENVKFSVIKQSKRQDENGNRQTIQLLREELTIQLQSADIANEFKKSLEEYFGEKTTNQ